MPTAAPNFVTVFSLLAVETLSWLDTDVDAPVFVVELVKRTIVSSEKKPLKVVPAMIAIMHRRPYSPVV